MLLGRRFKRFPTQKKSPAPIEIEAGLPFFPYAVA
jgi:hypothetical protein